MRRATARARSQPASPPGAFTIVAVIPKGTTHTFWQSIHAGARRRAGKELGVDVIWRGPLREDDRDSQVSEVEGFISRGVSGIVLAPLDEAALVGPVTDAVSKKIPVVIFDSGLKGDNYVSFVATDNVKGGRLGGERLPQRLAGKGKVVLLRYAEGHDSTSKREEGFLDAMKAHPGIEVVSSNQYGGADVEGAYKKSGVAAQQLQEARRQPGDRRHLLPERVVDVRDDAGAAGQRLGGQGEVRRLRRLDNLVKGLQRRRHRRPRRPGSR